MSNCCGCRRLVPESVPAAELLLADLAAAFSVGDVLTSFVTYDKRLRDAALLTGLPVVTPGVA